MWVVDGPLFPNRVSKYTAVLFTGRRAARVPGRVGHVIVWIIIMSGINGGLFVE